MSHVAENRWSLPGGGTTRKGVLMAVLSQGPPRLAPNRDRRETAPRRVLPLVVVILLTIIFFAGMECLVVLLTSICFQILLMPRIYPVRDIVIVIFANGNKFNTDWMHRTFSSQYSNLNKDRGKFQSEFYFALFVS